MRNYLESCKKQTPEFSPLGEWLEFGKECDFIWESRHVSDAFDGPIGDIVDKITELKNRGGDRSDFYSGWTWNSGARKCERDPSGEPSSGRFPINVQIGAMSVRGVAGMLLPRSWTGGKLIVVRLSGEYLDSLARRGDFERNPGDAVSDGSERAFFKSRRRTSFAAGLRQLLRHEFTHVLQSYVDVPKGKRSSIEHPSESKKYQSPALFTDGMKTGTARAVVSALGGDGMKLVEEVMYLNSPAEQDARVQGAFGTLEAMTDDEIREALKNSPASSLLTPWRWNAVLALRVYADEATQLDRYKRALEDLGGVYQSNELLPVLALAFFLNRFNLKRSFVGESYVRSEFPKIKSGRTLTAAEQNVCDDTMDYLDKRLLDFKKRVNEAVAEFVRRREEADPDFLENMNVK